MSDIESNARSARESLAKGLSLLQSNPNAPPDYLQAAEPIAVAMGALHRIETGGAGALNPAAKEALEAVRGALSILQAKAATDPHMMQTMEAVASSLGTVFGLTKSAEQAFAQAANPVARGTQPVQQPYQPPVQQPPAQVQPRAPYQPPMPGQAPHQPPVQQQPYQPPVKQQPYQPPVQQPYQPPVQQQPYQPPVQQQPYQPPVQQQPYQPPVQQPVQQQAYQPVKQPYAPPPAQPYAPPPQPAQPAQPYAPPPQPGPQPAFQPAGVAPAAAYQPPPQPAPVHAPQVQPAQPAANTWAEADPFAAPAPAAQPQPVATGGASAEPYRGGELPSIEAELGTHSTTNFYKGLSGNDVVDHGGLFVATYNVPAVGQTMKVQVSLPGGYEFDAVGVVRWTRESRESMTSDVSPPGFGIQFTHISPEARQLVYRYVRNREPLFHDDL